MRPFTNLVNSTRGKKAEKGNPADYGTPKTVTYWDEERNEKRPECVNCQEILHRGPPCRCNLCGAVNLEVLGHDEANLENTKPSGGGSSSSNSNKDDKNKKKNKNASSSSSGSGSSATKEQGQLNEDWQHIMVYRPGKDFVHKSQQQ
ncbi:hypothetical protein MCOR25_006171 [Pyricularia grisea]|uniref:Uncharacterized protein n=1 Tax=Pyricularia grisea TaxID=148305 RepID=A0A6P8BI97_PYRGI|nr:uncharacterized protein PgNI_01534 [Pyricularia grisea]KAI6362535.1 hypothetical protein MCOR25_006171 [Pyricularia grisea]TLD16359.1 hypothetical protein PgNI_01534 [Pyricularia grisea]